MSQRPKDTPAVEEQADAPPLHCGDCGVNVALLGEWYMLEDAIWQQATRDTPAHLLCVGCLEERLGRRLAPEDFNRAAPANLTREEDIDALLDAVPERLREGLRSNPARLARWKEDMTLLARDKSDRLRSRIEGTHE